MKQKKLSKSKDIIFYCLILAYPILQFCVFYVYVNFNSIMLAFKRYDVTTNVWSFAGLDNFKLFFSNLQSDPMWRTSIGNSFKITGMSIFVAMPLGLTFSYYMYKKYPLHTFFHVILFMPSIIASMVLALMYQYFTDRFLPSIAGNWFGSNMVGWFTNMEMMFPAVMIYCVWFSFGTSSLLYLGAMKGVSESTIEAAQIDGANTIQEFIFVIFPQIFSTVAVFIISAIAGIFVNQAGLFEFFGEKAEVRDYTVGYYLFVEVRNASDSGYPYLATIGLCITAIIAPICMLLRKYSAKVFATQ